MPLKRILGFLSICIALLAFPSDTFAFSCVAFSPSVYLECKDDHCQGFKVSTPICYWVSEVEDLTPDQLVSFKNYMQVRKGTENFAGVWELRISGSCDSIIHFATDIETSCGAQHLKHIEVNDFSKNGITFAKARSIAEARAFQDRAARAFSIFFQILFVIGFGSFIYLILVIRYILRADTNLRILIGAWPGILAVVIWSSAYIFFRYQEVIEYILLIAIVLFLIGRGMLIGNWVNNKVRAFNKLHA